MRCLPIGVLCSEDIVHRYKDIDLGQYMLKCGVILPVDYDHTKQYPVCIAISGERQQHVSKFFQAWKSETRGFSFVWLVAKRFRWPSCSVSGWVVVSPLRPDDHPLFFQRPVFFSLKLASLIVLLRKPSVIWAGSY